HFRFLLGYPRHSPARFLSPSWLLLFSAALLFCFLPFVNRQLVLQGRSHGSHAKQVGIAAAAATALSKRALVMQINSLNGFIGKHAHDTHNKLHGQCCRDKIVNIGASRTGVAELTKFIFPARGSFEFELAVVE